MSGAVLCKSALLYNKIFNGNLKKNNLYIIKHEAENTKSFTKKYSPEKEDTKSFTKKYSSKKENTKSFKEKYSPEKSFKEKYSPEKSFKEKYSSKKRNEKSSIKNYRWLQP